MKERVYTIKEVAAQTELSTQLIRKWEERYQAVTPQRMPNGYRAYSRQDIDTLRQLKQQVDQGVPIGMAVMEHGRERSQQAHDYTAGSTGPKLGCVPAYDGPPDLWEEPIRQLIEAIEQIDTERARAVYDRYIQAYPAEHVLMNILEPVLVELGERWQSRAISEYQEHFGSHFIRDHILTLCSLFRPQPEHPLLVTACGPGERHELGILFIGFFARQLGYRVVYLGASPAEKGIFDCLDDLHPAAFTFSFSSERRLGQAAAFLLELDRRIAAVSPGTLVFIGGAGVHASGLHPGTQAVHLIHGDGKQAMRKVHDMLQPAWR
ncbi:MerR family transcriptional regulator [Paenibacillus sp. 1P07SE]|uniref:MerR family transcriptional regulator n=1 Tax=Paenibacillus sp. 1P07SE TaxID=3132209 RepID=UPI0039A4DD80